MSNPHTSEGTNQNQLKMLSPEAAKSLGWKMLSRTKSDRTLLDDSGFGATEAGVIIALQDGYDKKHIVMRESLTQREVGKYLEKTEEGQQIQATIDGLRAVTGWAQDHDRRFNVHGQDAVKGLSREESRAARQKRETDAMHFIQTSGFSLAKSGQMSSRVIESCAQSIESLRKTAQSLAVDPRYTLEGEVQAMSLGEDGRIQSGWTYQGVTSEGQILLLAPDMKTTQAASLETLDAWNGHDTPRIVAPDFNPHAK